MPLSRKYYNAIADILHEVGNEYRDEGVTDSEGNWIGYGTATQGHTAVCEVTKELARSFLEDNPRFSKLKFIKAAGCLDFIRTGDL